MEQERRRKQVSGIVAAGSLFGLALAIRLIYLFQSSAGPAFGEPLVDAENYHRFAAALANGQPATDALFWQPLFYPVALSVVYRIVGVSVLAAQLVQAVLGATTCALTYRLGREVLGQRAGIVAGGIVALYGPLVFFESELVASGWAALWSVVLLLLLLRAAERCAPLQSLLFGVCGAAATLTRPTFLPFVAIAALWLVVAWRRNGQSWRRCIAGVLLTAAGFAAIGGPAALWSGRVSGRTSMLPASGGINLYVGNNPEVARTVGLRPGSEWRELTRSPRLAGVERKQDTPRYFTGLFVDYVRSEPAAFVAGLGSKSLQFLSSRELPRNLDVYVHRAWSSLLGVLTWKTGGFGFPFGLLFPLAFAGLVLRWRSIPIPMLLFLVIYPAAIVLVFVSARYRVPMVPVLAIMAAGGIAGLAEAARNRAAGGMLVVLGLLVVTLLQTLPGPFPQERMNYEAELHYLLARRAQGDDDLDRAAGLLARAIELDPEHSDAHNSLGTIHAKRRELVPAKEHLELAVRHNPRSVIALDNLARVLAAQGDMSAAAARFDEALEIEPYNAAILRRSSAVLVRLERLDDAERRLRTALDQDGADARVHADLGDVLLRLGRYDDAIEPLRTALRLAPWNRGVIDKLTSALRSAGRNDEAMAHLLQVRRRAVDSGRKPLADEISRQISAIEDR